jgi:1-acyl-sn-glycerol-3-phosphate acyltransferase
VLRQRIARLALRLSGWRNVGELPRRGIFVGAPHTSNWDYVFVLMVVWAAGMTPRILVKQELFRPPLSWLLAATGSLSVDRANPAGLVERLAQESRDGNDFVLVLAAEGTRSRGEFWKSGFYRLSQQTGLPVVLGFVDGPNKTIGVGETLTPTGDVRADMDRVRAFYADKPGLRPHLRTEPRLREETREETREEPREELREE